MGRACWLRFSDPIRRRIGRVILFSSPCQGHLSATQPGPTPIEPIAAVVRGQRRVTRSWSRLTHAVFGAMGGCGRHRRRAGGRHRVVGYCRSCPVPVCVFGRQRVVSCVPISPADRTASACFRDRLGRVAALATPLSPHAAVRHATSAQIREA